MKAKLHLLSLGISIACGGIAVAQAQSGYIAQTQEQEANHHVIPGHVTSSSAESGLQSQLQSQQSQQQLQQQQPAAAKVPVVHKTYSAPGFLVTTTSTVENYKIIEYKGVVEGAAVREPTWNQNAAVGAQEPYGGSLDAFAQMTEEARQQAFSTMVARAKEVGANGIIGIHFDSNTYQLDQGHVAHGVICVGTAVLVRPLR